MICVSNILSSNENGFVPPMGYTTMWLEREFVLLISSTGPLKANTTYTFEISPQAMSVDGVPLEEGYSFSFTTR